MLLTEPPVVFLTIATNGMIVLVNIDTQRKKIWIDSHGVDYITDYNIGAKISACALRHSVHNDWIDLRPLPFEVVLNSNYSLGIYVINNGIKLSDKNVQQFPLQTEKFILFTQPVELQRTISTRAAIKAGEKFLQTLNDIEEADYAVKEPTVREESTHE